MQYTYEFMKTIYTIYNLGVTCSPGCGLVSVGGVLVNNIDNVMAIAVNIYGFIYALPMD